MYIHDITDIYMYSPCISENLRELIEMQLSQKQKMCS